MKRRFEFTTAKVPNRRIIIRGHWPDLDLVWPSKSHRTWRSATYDPKLPNSASMWPISPLNVWWPSILCESDLELSFYDVIAPWPDLTQSKTFHQRLRKGCPIRQWLARRGASRSFLSIKWISDEYPTVVGFGTNLTQCAVVYNRGNNRQEIKCWSLEYCRNSPVFKTARNELLSFSASRRPVFQRYLLSGLIDQDETWAQGVSAPDLIFS